MKSKDNKIANILNKSSILYYEKDILPVIEKIAYQIDDEITNKDTVFLTVMNGGLFFAAELMKRIKSPIHCDYIHASRYRNEMIGSSYITWYRQPKIENLQGKIVYIIDDILDEGFTLVEIKRYIMSSGAKDCKLVVLVDKDIKKSKPVEADFVGLHAPNYFLFGFGMDIEGYFRQLPNIYIYNN